MSRSANELWVTGDEAAWDAACNSAWSLVKKASLEAVRKMELLTPAEIEGMTAEGWYSFLRDRYFPWKYRTPIRLASSRASLGRQVAQEGVAALDAIRREILDGPGKGLAARLKVPTRIGGVGPSGASGILALLYPTDFGTVDQVVVTALRAVANLPEREVLLAMRPQELSLSDAVLLIMLLRRKAAELNGRFGGARWTPRRVDLALWAVGHNP